MGKQKSGNQFTKPTDPNVDTKAPETSEVENTGTEQAIAPELLDSSAVGGEGGEGNETGTGTGEEVAVVEDDVASEPAASDEPTPPVDPIPTSSLLSPTAVVGDNDPLLTKSTEEVPVAKKSVPLIRLDSNLKNYVVEMAVNKPNNAKEGADLQRSLYRAIEGIIYTKDNGDFVVGMNMLLDTIDEHATGVFNERYVFRYWEELALPRTQRQEFEHLMRLFVDIGPKATRKSTVTPARLENAMHYVQNHEIKERLTEYVKRLIA